LFTKYIFEDLKVEIFLDPSQKYNFLLEISSLFCENEILVIRAKKSKKK